jgi:lipopolysaccharide heptosyltransferase II
MRKRESNFKTAAEYVVYLLYRAVGLGLALVPVRLTYLAGLILGWFGFFLLGKYREIAIANIVGAYAGWTDLEVKKCACRHFQRLCANLLCAFVLLQKPWRKVRKHFDCSDLERVRAQLDEAQRVVWVINHLGNWELFVFTVLLARKGEHGVVYQRLGNRFIDAHIRRSREVGGLRLIERQSGLSQCVSILKKGGMLAVLIDQHAGDKGIWTPFFGRLASTTPLPAILARKANAQLLPVAVYTTGIARWRLAFSDFIPRDASSIEEVTFRLNQVLEQQIRKQPYDWFWVHDRWKTPSPRFLLREYKRGVYVPPEAGPLKPFRILVRSSNWLGDAVMTAPAVRRIKRGRPDAHVTILTRSKLADFWRVVPEVDEIIAIQNKESVFEVARRLREKFEVAILFPNSPRVALEVWLARIPRRVGYRRPWRNWFLNQFIPEPAGPQPLLHQANSYLRIARRIGADVEEPLPALERWRPYPRLVGLCPGAEYGPAKRWIGFAEAAKRLSEKHKVRWMIFGTAKERPIGKRIDALLGILALNRMGRTSLVELIDELCQCRLLLTNDTGTMHLAAFLGIPTVAIFGSTEPRLTGPLGQGHRVLHHHVPCSPCFLRECPIDFRCMKAVTVEEVVAAVEETLAKTEEAVSGKR